MDKHFERVDNSAPAFPIAVEYSRGGVGFDGADVKPGTRVTYAGLSRREYFAAHAPFTISDARQWLELAEIYDHTPTLIFEALAKMRWDYADAMLAARTEEQ